MLHLHKKDDQEHENLIFTDMMEPGVVLIPSHGFMIPDYLTISSVRIITLDDHLNPAELDAFTAYVFNDNLYLTDEKGNIAFIDCHLVHTTPTAQLRSSHPEYRKAGGANRGTGANKDTGVNRDAGHFGLSLGQHPSIAMEQDSYMNRYGIWRSFERSWSKELKLGKTVHIIGVFVEGEDADTYSPFWCIREEIDDEVNEYVLTNDDDQ